MKKHFNVNGICYPDENYMVDLSERLKKIKILVVNKKYLLLTGQGNMVRQRLYGPLVSILRRSMQ